MMKKISFSKIDAKFQLQILEKSIFLERIQSKEKTNISNKSQ